MNENINLCQILKDCPKGTKLWSPVWGDITFEKIDAFDGLVYVLKHKGVHIILDNGKFDADGECIIFPSKDQRDWSKFERFWDKPKVEKFDPKTLQPFDKVLVRDGGEFEWHPSFLERIVKQSPDGYSAVELIARCRWKMCIPYNDETKCLSWTKDDCPEYYKWWKK